MPFGNGGGSGKSPQAEAPFRVEKRDSKQLFFRDDSRNTMSVSVRTQPVFTSPPQVIVPGKTVADLFSRTNNLDVSPDGQRFLIHQQSSEAGLAVQINV